MDYLILTPTQLAAALKDRRKSLGLTQVEAAARVGLLPKTISSLESSPERCSIESLLKLISVLDIELSFTAKPRKSEDSANGGW